MKIDVAEGGHRPPGPGAALACSGMPPGGNGADRVPAARRPGAEAALMAAVGTAGRLEAVL